MYRKMCIYLSKKKTIIYYNVVIMFSYPELHANFRAVAKVTFSK